ncbi:hypothetical protein JXH92_003662 [Salmonella enterica subsp. enterica serovar 4,[5],12:b:-]|nr:hypothetical protein [Salmonella enterica subsp. enterica serovar 4,[5],12:b:-]
MNDIEKILEIDHADISDFIERNFETLKNYPSMAPIMMIFQVVLQIVENAETSGESPSLVLTELINDTMRQLKDQQDRIDEVKRTGIKIDK